jgi:hypothetical protein
MYVVVHSSSRGDLRIIYQKILSLSRIKYANIDTKIQHAHKIL